MNQKLFLVLIALFLSTSAFAGDDRERCDRGKGWSKLTDEARSFLLKEDASKKDKFVNMLAVPKKTKDSAFNLAHIYKIVAVDPESAMAVFSRYEDSPKYLKPEIVSAKVLEPLKDGKYVPSKEAKIRYEFNPGMLVPNSTYVVLDRLSQFKKTNTHNLSWERISSSGGIGSPLYIDGFMKAEPAGSNTNYTLITYCNYVVPDVSEALAGEINEQGLELMKKTVSRTSEWILNQSKDQMNTALSDYRSIKFDKK